MNGLRTLALQDLPHVLPAKQLQTCQSLQLHTGAVHRRFWNLFEFNRKDESNCRDVKKSLPNDKRNEASFAYVPSREDILRIPPPLSQTPTAGSSVSLGARSSTHSFHFEPRTTMTAFHVKPRPEVSIFDHLTSLLDGSPVPTNMKLKLKGYKTLRTRQAGDFAFVPGGVSYEVDLVSEKEAQRWTSIGQTTSSTASPSVLPDEKETAPTASLKTVPIPVKVQNSTNELEMRSSEMQVVSSSAPPTIAASVPSLGKDVVSVNSPVATEPKQISENLTAENIEEPQSKKSDCQLKTSDCPCSQSSFKKEQAQAVNATASSSPSKIPKLSKRAVQMEKIARRSRTELILETGEPLPASEWSSATNYSWKNDKPKMQPDKTFSERKIPASYTRIPSYQRHKALIVEHPPEEHLEGIDRDVPPLLKKNPPKLNDVSDMVDSLPGNSGPLTSFFIPKAEPVSLLSPGEVDAEKATRRLKKTTSQEFALDIIPNVVPSKDQQSDKSYKVAMAKLTMTPLRRYPGGHLESPWVVCESNVRNTQGDSSSIFTFYGSSAPTGGSGNGSSRGSKGLFNPPPKRTSSTSLIGTKSKLLTRTVENSLRKANSTKVSGSIASPKHSTRDTSILSAGRGRSLTGLSESIKSSQSFSCGSVRWSCRKRGGGGSGRRPRRPNCEEEEPECPMIPGKVICTKGTCPPCPCPRPPPCAPPCKRPRCPRDAPCSGSRPPRKYKKPAKCKRYCCPQLRDTECGYERQLKQMERRQSRGHGCNPCHRELPPEYRMTVCPCQEKDDTCHPTKGGYPNCPPEEAECAPPRATCKPRRRCCSPRRKSCDDSCPKPPPCGDGCSGRGQRSYSVCSIFCGSMKAARSIGSLSTTASTSVGAPLSARTYSSKCGKQKKCKKGPAKCLPPKKKKSKCKPAAKPKAPPKCKQAPKCKQTPKCKTAPKAKCKSKPKTCSPCHKKEETMKQREKREREEIKECKRPKSKNDSCEKKCEKKSKPKKTGLERVISPCKKGGGTRFESLSIANIYNLFSNTVDFGLVSRPLLAPWLSRFHTKSLEPITLGSEVKSFSSAWEVDRDRDVEEFPLFVEDEPPEADHDSRDNFSFSLNSLFAWFKPSHT